jgi:hypothetical protein
MFSLIFWGSWETFHVFFHSFSGQHRQETSGKNSWKKIPLTANLMLNIPLKVKYKDIKFSSGKKSLKPGQCF